MSAFNDLNLNAKIPKSFNLGELQSLIVIKAENDENWKN